MKETIKKSIIGGVTFFFTVVILYIAYATAVYNLPVKVTNGSGLLATQWNNMVDSIDYLKAITDTQSGQISTINSKFTSENWLIPTLANGWVYYGSPRSTVGYYKNSLGIVYIKGLVKSGTINTCIFTLPVGYRPLEEKIIVGISDSGISRIDIGITGCLNQVNIGGNGRLSLDGISFRAEQ